MSEEKVLKELTLRDYFASQVDISYDKAMEFLVAIKFKEKDSLEGRDIVSLLLGMKGEKITLGELAEMRALMRYIEADCMCRMRKGTNKEQFAYVRDLMEDSNESEGDRGRWEGIIGDEEAQG